jgi:hypothetical protein
VAILALSQNELRNIKNVPNPKENILDKPDRNNDLLKT